ncbi:trafficking protein particle complex subunit 8 isoform X1 [Rosa chinensis]|nr:trafficking protein particle complex subunit 8 isoform X1 [Rosa chinensis]
MVDPANTPLGKMLLEEITPVVMVLRTPLVEEACQKNGLTFVQMLRPFCVFNNFDVPVRTASDQPYRLQKFRLRLFYDSDVRQPNLEVSKERLKQVITQAGEKDLSELCSELPQINNAPCRPESEALPSWFQFFNKELVHTVSFSDHEAFDHPLACLIVVSSKDDQPINRFLNLFNSNKLPSLLNSGAMDPNILKHYLLVHDNQDGSSEKATKRLTEMRSTFGSDCQLLCINSSQDGAVEHQDNPWVLYSSEDLPSQPLRCFLNVDDFNEIKDLMQDFSSKHIIPYMEQKIRVLNQQVSATRKGFRNQIKNLWWRKGKDEVVDSPSGPTYTFSSIESQIRVLGDYAFMLRDYELALSNYRLISTDYKLDKAWKRFAGAQEMMGLAYFMLDHSRKEAESCMDTAFTYYLKYALSSQQNATRCGLWWVEMLKARYQYREAATVYFRVGAEEPLHSAVMLEQASYCYLLSKPPMLHKYGFHLVLSGDRYKKCDQIKHAIRTYRSAMSVYKGTTWSHIKDHIHFHLAQWYALLGLYDLAVSHMLEVLACRHQSKTMQELFLKDFLEIVQKTGKKFEVSKLQLPEINIPSLRVFFEDHRTYASSAAASVKERLWRSLEEEMVPSTSTGRTNWLELQSKLIPKKFKESNICVAGEAVKIDIEFKNPLQIPLLLSSVYLICELSASTDEMKSDENNSLVGVQNNDESTKLNHRDVDSETLFSLSDVDVSMGGGETTLVQLTVTPRVEGVLQIVGVKWKLSDFVVGFHNFDTRSVKIIGKQRQKANHPLSINLKFAVVKSVPKLEGVIHSLPERAYAGDVRHLVLELKNQSEFSVKNLKMKISHPRFLNVGQRESLNSEFPACLGKKTSQHSDIRSDSDVSHSVFLFPEDTKIQGEKPLLWPLWFRAALPGNISLDISIYYEMGDVSSGIKYRTLRMHYNLQVLPSLDVSFQISPCPSRLREFLVRMDVVNKTSSESFQVHQLSSVGQKWEVSLLQPVDAIFPSQSLMAHQALSCFFMLKSRSKPSTSEDETSSCSPLLGSDVTLSTEGSCGPLFDIASSPLADFHHCERLQQEISHKGDVNTVDFILISRPLKNDAHPVVSDLPHLFSHHACHCSIESSSPILWLVDGPRTLYHNFSASFCEINFHMTIYNSSDVIASVCIKTYDSNSDNLSDAIPVQPATSSSNQDGWHDLPLVNEIRVTSDVVGARTGKSSSVESVTPFIWSGSSSTKVELEPKSRAEIPLQVCVFSPGTFDLSNYVLHWKLLLSNGDGLQSSGACQGYPYFLTVLQSA